MTEGIRSEASEKPERDQGANEKEALRNMRSKIRLHAARFMIEGQTLSGLMLAYGGSVADPRGAGRILSLLGSNKEADAVTQAALIGLNYAARKGGRMPRPTEKGWGFLDEVIKYYSTLGKGELAILTMKIAYSAPLFLAATFSDAARNWIGEGQEEDLKRLATFITERAAEVSRRSRLSYAIGWPEPSPG